MIVEQTGKDPLLGLGGQAKVVLVRTSEKCKHFSFHFAK